MCSFWTKTSLACGRYLKDTVSAMEYDFNIRLSNPGRGARWTESKDGKVSPVIRAEQAVFRAWIEKVIKVFIAFLLATLPMGNRVIQD